MHLPESLKKARLAESARTAHESERIFPLTSQLEYSPFARLDLCQAMRLDGRMTSINLRLICPSMSACPTRICDMGQPCTATSPLLLPINPRKTYVSYSWQMVRSGYTRAKNDNQNYHTVCCTCCAAGVTRCY